MTRTLTLINTTALLIALTASLAALHQANVLQDQMHGVQAQLAAMSEAMTEIGRIAKGDCHDCRWRMLSLSVPGIQPSKFGRSSPDFFGLPLYSSGICFSSSPQRRMALA